MSLSQPLSQALSQQQDRDIRVVRLGDVEGFAVLAALQSVLRAQIAALRKHFYYMPECFEATVRALWCKYVTASGINYSEERIKEDDTGLELEDETDKASIGRIPDDHLVGLKIGNPYGSSRPPRLSITLALIFLSCLHCKVPLLLSELHRLASDGLLPFLSVISCLAAEEQESLSKSRRRYFERSSMPTLLQLHSLCGRLAGFLAYAQRVPLPIMEPVIVVWKGLGWLGMPLDLYPVALRVLGSFRGNKIEYRVCQSEGKRHYLAEVSVMASLVFLIKLIYGLKTFKRNNESKVKSRHYHNLVTKHGLPNYGELMEWWESQLVYLATDFARNNGKMLFWCDMDRYSEKCAITAAPPRQLDGESVRELLLEMPDLASAIGRLESPFPRPQPRAPQPENPWIDKDVDLTKAVSVTMARSCLTYGFKYRPEQMHRPFRVLLELAAASVGIEDRDMYRAYYCLFEKPRSYCHYY